MTRKERIIAKRINELKEMKELITVLFVLFTILGVTLLGVISNAKEDALVSNTNHTKSTSCASTFNPPINILQEVIAEESSSNKENVDKVTAVSEPPYDNLEFLANVVTAEAGNQGLLGMRYVACTILNRVDSDHFPNTVKEVLLQKDPSIQFSSVYDGGIERYPATNEARKAVELEIKKRSNDKILFFRTGHYHKFGSRLFRHKAHYFSGE